MEKKYNVFLTGNVKITVLYTT